MTHVMCQAILAATLWSRLWCKSPGMPWQAWWGCKQFWWVTIGIIFCFGWVAYLLLDICLLAHQDSNFDRISCQYIYIHIFPSWSNFAIQFFLHISIYSQTFSPHLTTLTTRAEALPLPSPRRRLLPRRRWLNLPRLRSACELIIVSGWTGIGIVMYGWKLGISVYILVS